MGGGEMMDTTEDFNSYVRKVGYEKAIKKVVANIVKWDQLKDFLERVFKERDKWLIRIVNTIDEDIKEIKKKQRKLENSFKELKK